MLGGSCFSRQTHQKILSSAGALLSSTVCGTAQESRQSQYYIREQQHSCRAIDTAQRKRDRDLALTPAQHLPYIEEHIHGQRRGQRIQGQRMLRRTGDLLKRMSFRIYPLQYCSFEHSKHNIIPMSLLQYFTTRVNFEICKSNCIRTY